MTHRSRIPTRHNKGQHTAYERNHRNSRHFGYDAHSCRHGTGIWPDLLSDIEDLTMLEGLEEA